MFCVMEVELDWSELRDGQADSAPIRMVTLFIGVFKRAFW